MGALKGLIVRVRALARPRQADQDLDSEISFHVERETEKHIALGVPPNEARRRALIAFGGVQQTREAHRGVRRAAWLEELAADARYALRTLGRSPALTGAAVLTLALGIGANTAMFSAVNAVILRPLPFAEPRRLVMLWEENEERGWHRQTVAPANMLDWKDQVPAFEDVAAYADFRSQTTLTEHGEPRLLTSSTVTGNLFSVLGVRAQVGRPFRTDETWETGALVTVISDRLWRSQFGARTDIVGESIQLGGRAVQVVGVMPPELAFPWEDVDVWRPTAWPTANQTAASFRRAHWMRAIARLKPGVSPEQATIQLREVATRLEQEYPVLNKSMGAGLTPLHEFLVGDTRRPLLILLGAVALLLLIACANVGNLLLVHAAGRERETALRVALGAGRLRLVRQALTESLVLSLIGGVAGVGLGWWGTRTLAALQPAGMLRVSTFALDWSVLAYVFAITAVSGLLFGIAPAVWSGRRLPVDALREGSRTGSDGRRMRQWGDRLVVGEVALAVLLTVGAGLFVRSFRELRRIDPGFEPRGLVEVPVTLPGSRYDSGDKLAAFYAAVLARVQNLPGVEGAALARELPLTQPAWSSDFIAAGRPPAEFGTEVLHREVSPDYFRTMGVPLLRGRAFTADDRSDAATVVIINEALAKSYFGARDPLGERIAFDRAPDSASVWRTIVGVVGNEHQSSLAIAPRTEIFAPLAQDQTSGFHIVARSRCADGAACTPELLASGIRRAVAEIDPRLALGPVRTLTKVYEDSMARERFLMTLLLAFAVVGLSLAVVGVYGVLAQLARRRSREMGIRIALGARSSQVRWLVVRHGLRLTTIGLALGGVAALLSTRAVRGMLYGIAPGDPLTYIVVAGALATTSLIASWLPALKASRADPAVTLRGD
jgi:putative ABC transport system permease protein